MFERIKRLFGNDDQQILRGIEIEINKIEELASEYTTLSDDQLKAKTHTFIDFLQTSNNTIEQILAPAFATVREAARRVMQEYPFHVQLIGGYVLHHGDVAEMRTGEGKTLTAISAIYLNALQKRGVHVVTVNEYLAERDAMTYGAILTFLGLSVGVNKANLSLAEKKTVYQNDVTYTTHSELGFDYLRDNMAQSLDQKVIHELHYAIIDECDSILVDEARTPLIISGQATANSDLLTKCNQFTKLLDSADYVIDHESHTISLTSSGQQKAADFFVLKVLYCQETTNLIHYLQNALKAHHVMALGKEYIVRDNKIVLVDQFTGRILDGRTYSGGLHQAIEVKENVIVTPETKTMATITYQNFFRLYKKISGMTGTAKTEEKEFVDIYNMRVIEIPTNKPMIRLDEHDQVFATKSAKYKSILKRVQLAHKKNVPILIGTTSITTSEEMSQILDEASLPHVVLNAKFHAEEAKIIANAGLSGQITIATNMAGRGTDIKITADVAQNGGLLVIGSERHESRRIDNQLRGRCGRQGDPGNSIFYLSVEDDLIVRFGTEKLRFLYAMMGDDPIHGKLINKSIIRAQQKIEGLNYDQRKYILEYDNVLSQHRELMYRQRDFILAGQDLDSWVHRIMESVIRHTVHRSTRADEQNQIFVDVNLLALNIYELKLLTDQQQQVKFTYDINLFKYDLTKVQAYLFAQLDQVYATRKANFDKNVVDYVEKNASLQIFDHFWTEHIDLMVKLRTGIYLRGYSQKNPLQEYIDEAASIFDNTRYMIALNIIRTLLVFNLTPEAIENLPSSETQAIKSAVTGG